MIVEDNIAYSDLKKEYINCTMDLNKMPIEITQNRFGLNRLIQDWRTDIGGFYGATTAQVIGWLHNGYRQPGLVIDPPIVPTRKRRRLKFAEEGELQIDLAYSGHDYPFIAWDERMIMPGMSVRIYTQMESTTPASVFIAYNRWILRALIALEEAGIDLEVWMTAHLQSCFARSHNELRFNIKVKNEGEQTDFVSWSPILSPGGFRHLDFLATYLISDRNGYEVKSGMGHGKNMGESKWRVSYDPDTLQLKFECPWVPKIFPEAEMDIQLREVLQNVRKVA